MNYYTEELTKEIQRQKFAFLEVTETDHVLTITLNRERQKNALHPHMVNELAYCLSYSHSSNDVWVVVIQAKGNVFCSGADLKALAGMIEEHESTVPEPATPVLLGDLFNQMHVPVISKVTGDVYAGGFFFLAGSSIVVACDSVKFGLPEVKRGLFPFQVMSSLMRVMPPRKVLDWCIRGYNLPATEAFHAGLVTHLASNDNIDQTVETIIGELKENSPAAIRNGMEAYRKIQNQNADHQYLMEMLQKTLMTNDGQEGIRAFREKRSPIWTGQ